MLNEPLPDGRKPITLGVTEPFMTTVTVSAYAALLIALPVILYQLYAFVLPAFSPTRAARRAAAPADGPGPVHRRRRVRLLRRARPRRCDFLLNFNDNQFNIQVRARDYYSFVALTLLAMGLLFQVPMAILAVTRLGIVTPQQLRESRRYAYFACAVVAALLPTRGPGLACSSRWCR